MSRLARLQAIAREVVNDPVEAGLTFWGKLQERKEYRKPRFEYPADPDWEQRLHATLDVAFPCSTSEEVQAVWAEVLSDLVRHGVNPGPASYSGWNDGDPAFLRAIWCLIRHLRATRVVETGVAHGVTSRFILEALQSSNDGRLWSIDLPVQLHPDLHSRIGICVGDGFARRWSYIKGSSRRRLPALLRRIGPIDLFIHDSRHTEYNLLFELREAWRFLRPGGAMVVDDIDLNHGFQIFTQTLPDHSTFIAEAEPIRPDVVRYNQKGLFGTILKGDRQRRLGQHL